MKELWEDFKSGFVPNVMKKIFNSKQFIVKNSVYEGHTVVKRVPRTVEGAYDEKLCISNAVRPEVSYRNVCSRKDDGERPSYNLSE